MPRLVGIDYGTKRIGLAKSDPQGIVATPWKRIDGGLEKVIAAIGEIDCDLIVIGLPLHMNGTESEMSKSALAFGEKLKERTGIEVRFWDERLTSKQVERLMAEAFVSRKKRTEHTDLLAATVILQNYIDSHLI